MRPLIALTTTSYAGTDFRVPQVMLGSPYLAAVESMGGAAVLLTPGHDPASVERLLDTAHGLLLSGGEDVDPSRYGQAPHPKLGTVNRERDEMEFRALEGALRREMPVLAICRGMQLLNVAMGGTLFQDIPSQREGDLLHEQTAPINQQWHGATVDPDSRLAEVFGATELRINSFHHQGIDRLGAGLRASAWAEDGLVEGVEGVERPWLFGVQWHPERGEAHLQGDRRNPDRRLFWAFIEAARSYGADGKYEVRGTKYEGAGASG